jgi:hypothetical protein
MMRCEACATAIPDDCRSCPSCGNLLSGASLDNSILLGQVAEEFTRAIRDGREPVVEEYVQRHPTLAERIRELLSTLMLLEAARGEQGLRQEPTADSTADTTAAPHLAGSTPNPDTFVAGTVLLNRYRIIGLLDRGGMGELYKAEDLKLGQQVALKFLPNALAFNGAALARFHREISLARQVSHPNVCRVFDINEVEGRHFLSMEYIDGENLASLIRRIGRLPQGKGVEIALQLCRGLAAAHENNVLHCDLKPANIMIDGRGRARITDFGLARLANELGRIDAGTPIYMAPEQLARLEASPKSDIYSLGLILYEIFTGKRAFQTENRRELLLMHERSGPVRPSKLVADIDPTIDRLILRCLRKDPDQRSSLPQILGVLSGGDPLASALAAGETPSPELIASAPGEGAMRPRAALAALGLFIISLALMELLSGIGLLHREVPLDKPPAVLADRAAAIVESLGYTDPPRDVAYGFERDDAYLNYVVAHDPSPDRWKRLGTGRPAALYFWYRQSPNYLVAYNQGKITPVDPPTDTPGMRTVFLDTKGRLTGFVAVPGSSAEKGVTLNWSLLFEKAGLSPGDFKQILPQEILQTASDARGAWEGSFPEQPDVPIHIEAASNHGSAVFFKISGWSSGPKSYTPSEGRAGFRQGAESRAFFTFGFTVCMTAIVVGAILARRNIWLGRGDRRGATRLGLYLLAVQILAWALQAHHVWMVAEFDLLYTALAWAMFYAANSWILYMALEPYIRRRWPYRIISWNRLLSGKFHDPMVGRDILIGASFGTAFTLLASYSYLGMKLLGMPPDKPPSVSLDTLLGTRNMMGQFLGMQKEIVMDPLYVFFTLLLLSSIFHKDWRAFVIAWILFTFGGAMLFGIQHPINLAVIGLVVAGYLSVLARFGLLATIAFQFCNFVLLNFPLTSNFANWYAGTTVFALLITVGFALYGFFAAISGQAVFGRGLLQE